MRIAVVTPEYPPDTIGGGGVVVKALVNEYLADHDVEVFSAADSMRSWLRRRWRDTSEEHVTVNRYPLIPLFRRRAFLRSAMAPNLSSYLELWKDLGRFQPDVAHLHGYGYALTDLAAFALRRTRTPYILTLHGLPSTPSRHHSAIRFAYKVYQRFGVGRTLRGAGALTAVSIAVADELGRRHVVEVIPNGISPLPTSNERRVVKLKQTLGLTNGVPIIAAAGRLSVTKGFDVLIRALDQVAIPELECVIVGSDGGALKSLAYLAARVRTGISVKLPGPVGREDLADLFAVADVVVVPSREEPFGLVALEALAAGKRLVASNTGGLAEFLHPGVAQLVAPGDIQALASAVTTGITRGQLSAVELVRIRELLARYSWHSIAKEYIQLMAKSRAPQAKTIGPGQVANVSERSDR